MAQISENDHCSNSTRDTAKRHISRESPPGWLWTLALAPAGLVALATLLGALAIALGAADPPRAARPVWHAEDWAWVGGESLALAAGEEGWAVAPRALPAAARFTLGVRARLESGAGPGAAWGVWIATADGARIVYALSGEGYTTTRRCPPGDAPPALEDCPAVRPEWRWTAYPRLNPPGQTNQLELDREQPGALRLRLNRERLGLAAAAPAGPWGVWWRGGRASGATLAWQQAILYQD